MQVFSGLDGLFEGKLLRSRRAFTEFALPVIVQFCCRFPVVGLVGEEEIGGDAIVVLDVEVDGWQGVEHDWRWW